MKVEKFAVEVMLLDWSESPRGAKIVLLLSDEDDLELFKQMTLGKGKIAGQRLALGVAMIGETEKIEPITVAAKSVAKVAALAGVVTMAEIAAAFDADRKVPDFVVAAAEGADAAAKKKSTSHFPGGLTGLAVQWCIEDSFQKWVLNTYPTEVRMACEDMVENSKLDDVMKAVMCGMCGIESRKELDTDDVASAVFMDMFRGPYMEHIAAVAA